MLLTVNIGNTNTVLGIYDGDVLLKELRIGSVDRTRDELRVLLEMLLTAEDIGIKNISGIVIGSVVPSLDRSWTEVADRFGVPVIVVEPELETGMKIDIDAPGEVGADRIADAIAAREKFGAPVVVIDVGTAITVDAVAANGDYIGGATSPGINTALSALFSKAAKLPMIELAVPQKVIGRNTVTSIQSGIICGLTGLVDHLASRALEELGTRAPVVATGGQVHLIAEGSKVITDVDRDLTLYGLKLIFDRCAER